MCTWKIDGKPVLLIIILSSRDTVELQWLKQAGVAENWFQSKVVPASHCMFLSL